MRYKSMPLSIRHSSPTSSSAPPPGGGARRSWWLDWMLTLPILLLIPVVLVPIIVKGVGPSLAIEGDAVAGQQIIITGTGFPSGRKVRLVWDGVDAAPWLPTPKVRGDGSFRVITFLPDTTSTGQHLLAATQVTGNDRKANARSSDTLATLTVQVVDPVAAETETASPTPKAAPTATPKPTAAATPAASGAASETPRPSATPQPTAPPPTDTAVVGYGAGTRGGAGGRQLAVTNLADSGPGSLRDALEASGPRTVVFRVEGTISLRGSIHVKDPYLTVAGETAPGAGITVRNGALLVKASEVILRQIRLRPGDQVDQPNDVDALTINGASNPVSNVVVDHVTTTSASSPTASPVQAR